MSVDKSRRGLQKNWAESRAEKWEERWKGVVGSGCF